MGMRLINYFETRDLTAQFVRITGRNSLGYDENMVNWATIHHICLPPLQAKQILDVRGRGEVRSPFTVPNGNTNVECVTNCTLHRNWVPNSVDNDAQALIIAPAMGSNITLNAEFADLNFAALFEVPVDLPQSVVQWRLRCRQNPATFHDYCEIMDRYGFLQIAIFG